MWQDDIMPFAHAVAGKAQARAATLPAPIRPQACALLASACCECTFSNGQLNSFRCTGARTREVVSLPFSVNWAVCISCCGVTDWHVLVHSRSTRARRSHELPMVGGHI